jgi:hypothetical protein
VDKTTLKVAQDTFIEVKKFARVDLDGKDLKPLSGNVPCRRCQAQAHRVGGQGTSPHAGARQDRRRRRSTTRRAGRRRPGGCGACACRARPRGSRSGCAAPAAPAPDENKSKMVGVWEKDGGG